MAIADIRAATEADVTEIARIQRDTWRTAYAEIVPPSALEQLTGPAAHAAWRAVVSSDEGHLLVATEGQWTVGFCAATPAGAESPDEPAGQAQIAALLVEPRWGRRGHGRRLLAAAFEALMADGASSGIAWVPEQDVASRAFYDRAGWDPDGYVRTLDAGDRQLREIRVTGGLRFENRDPRKRALEPDVFREAGEL
jgi:ribosomal protein S18 acetylase RimI-like enzyme